MKRIQAMLLVGFLWTTAASAQASLTIIPQLGHSAAVTSLDISRDGGYLLSTCTDPVVLLWDLRSGKQLRSFIGHTKKVFACAFSPDSKFAVTTSDDWTIIKWDVGTGKAVWKVDTQGEKDAISFSPDGRMILIGGAGMPGKSGLELLDAETGVVIRTYDQESRGYNTSGDILCLAFSPDGTHFVTGHEHDGRANLWKTDETVCEQSLKDIRFQERHDITCMAYSADGTRIATGGWDQHLNLWDASRLEIIDNTLSWMATAMITALAISPDGRHVACGDDKARIRCFDADSADSYLDFEPGQCTNIKALKFSSDGKYLISGSLDHAIIVWDAQTGRMVKRLGGTTAVPLTAALSPDNKQIAGGFFDYTARVWDRLSGKETAVMAGHTMQVNAVCFTRDGKRLLSGGGGLDEEIGSMRIDSKDHSIRLWDIATEKEVKKFEGHTFYIWGLDVAPDGKSFVSASTDKTMKLWDFNKPQPLYTHTFTDEGPVNNAVFSPDGKIVYISTFGKVTALDLGTKTATVIDGSHGDETKRSVLSGDGKILAWITDGHIELFDCVERCPIRAPVKYDDYNFSHTLAISRSGRLLVDGTDNHSIRIIDLQEKKVLPYFTGHTAKINSVLITDDEKQVVSASADGTFRVWDVATGRWVAFLSHTNKRDWLAYTDDGYWDASPKGGELVAMVKGSECWNIDQFAVKNNRPDIILERLGSTDRQLIAHYHAQYKKRLRRLGLTEEQLASEGSVPTTEITRSTVTGKFCEIGIHFHDEDYKLTRYNVFVNDVPLFGAAGKTVDDDDIECTESVELTQGENKIEVSCMNEKGAESFRAVTYAAYTEPAKKNLYVLAFGVSAYQNASYNLQYADKDARDLAGVIAGLQGKGFEHVYTKVLTNAEVTPEAIRESKSFVKDAKPDDYFVLFIAGHGMHDTDAEATYYYLTANADVKNLKATAADFETVEDLLQGIAPRNKVFLMDACESGELDPEEQGVMAARAAGSGMASRGFKTAGFESASSAASPGPKRTYLYEKDRFIYNDLVRRSGAVVFSSSKGGELSYERSDLKNGLFTNSILKAISKGEADKDHDGVITIDELREYVSIDVAKSTDELQHPTIDRDNIYQKIGFTIK